MHIVAYCFARYLFLCPLRHSFPVDPEVPTDQEPYPSEDQFTQCRASRQANPLDHSYIAQSFSLVLALVCWLLLLLLSVAPISDA